MRGVISQYYEVVKPLNTYRLMLPLPILAPGSPALAGPDGHRGLEPGRAHEVVATVVPTEGLEVGMPRDGWYARGIELDRKGDWRASTEAYREAIVEFSKMRRSRPGWEEVIDGWLLRARFQKDQSSRLFRYVGFSRRSVVSHSSFSVALALHHKWLGIRAFTGRADASLKQRVIDEYRRAILGSRYNGSVRLYLAVFYRQAGMHALASMERSRISTSRRAYLYLEDAAYHAAGGDTDLAFAAMEKAARSSGNRRIARMSNLLDPLRGDPRFARLVGRTR